MSLHPDIERVALIGWALYPCVRSKSKAAMFKGATDKATSDLDTLERWQHEYPDANWRVVCGPSKIWGIDIDAPGPDHPADGVQAFKDLCAKHGPLPEKPTTRSGGGGYAIFFRHNDEPIWGKTGTPAPGLDPRRGRLSVTLPPSIHHRTGKPYRWLVAPWEVNAPDAPQWLLDAVKPPPEPEFKRPKIVDDTRARRALLRAVDAIRSAPSGSGNDTLNRRAHYVFRCVAAGLLSEGEAIDALYAAALDRRIPRMEARDTIKSARRAGYQKPLEAVS
jgi:hypothetical protein